MSRRRFLLLRLSVPFCGVVVGRAPVTLRVIAAAAAGLALWGAGAVRAEGGAPPPAPAEAAASPESREAWLRNFILWHTAGHRFSGNILVKMDGRVVYRGSFGLADRAFGVPCAEDTRFRIASITKVFTAALLLRLAEEGKVDLDAVIKTYLPDYAGDAAGKVNLRQLLNHTSGLPNLDAAYTGPEDAARRGMPHYQVSATPAELVRRFYSGNLVREPGREFDYNNADYLILGRIIEAVTGKTYAEALRERLLDLLGMTDTGMCRREEILPRLAPTYSAREGTTELENDLPLNFANFDAAGGLYSTAGDLMKFADALYGGKLLRAESLERMLTPGLEGYGYGLWTGNPVFGGRICQNANRPGRILGANGSFYHFHGLNFAKSVNIVILSNTNLTDLDGFSWEIGKRLMR